MKRELQWVIYVFGLGASLVLFVIDYAQSHFAPKSTIEFIKEDISEIREDSKDIKKSQDEIIRILLQRR